VSIVANKTPKEAGYASQKRIHLIELLIVVAIIGILAALLIPNAMPRCRKPSPGRRKISAPSPPHPRLHYDKDAVVNNGDISTTMKSALSPCTSRFCLERSVGGNFKYLPEQRQRQLGITIRDRHFLVAS